MPQQELGNPNISTVAQLSQKIDVPIVKRQLDARTAIRKVVRQLTYPVNTGKITLNLPAVFNNHPADTEIEAWAKQAAGIEGSLSDYGFALSTVLTSVGKAKQEGPIPGKQPLAALDGRTYRLFNNTPQGHSWDLHYQGTSDVLVRAWATGSTQALESGLDQYNERLNAENNNSVTNPQHLSRRSRNFILRDIASILLTSR